MSRDMVRALALILSGPAILVAVAFVTRLLTAGVQ
jgi:hypothetical protein